MSGVSRLVLKDNKGLEQPTNEDLREVGTCGADSAAEDAKEKEGK